MSKNIGPLSILFFQRLRELAYAAGRNHHAWREGKKYNAVVCGPAGTTEGLTEDEQREVEVYGGLMVCESAAPTVRRFMSFMDPRAAFALAEQMLRSEASPLTIEQARVIATWRVDLGCTWGRVGELAEIVWGKESGQLAGERLCAEAEQLLGRCFDDEIADAPIADGNFAEAEQR
jgi:hypothetical protein